MKLFKTNGCFKSCFSFGCLSILLLFLVLIFVIQKKSLNTDLFNTKDNTTNVSVKDKKNTLAVIVAMSDSENANDQVNKVLNFAKDINADSVFHLGDLTHLGVPANLMAISGIFKKSDLTVYSVPGDRDLWKSRGLASYNKYLGKSYGLHTINGINFLFIDNANEYEGIDDKQWNFIKENLDKSNFIVLHNPLFSTNIPLIGDKKMGEYDNIVNTQRKELLDMVRNSNVKAIFAGDQHYYSETPDAKKPNLKQFVVSSINPNRSIQLPNFTVLTVFDDLSYKVDKVVLGN